MSRYMLNELSLKKLEYGSGAAACKYDGCTRYVRITDIDNEGNLGEDIVSPNSVDEKYVLHDGDILFARTGATVGKTYLYRHNDGRCIYAGFLIRLVPDTKLIRPEYLFYYTKSPRYKRFVQSSMKVVAQPNINAKQYGELDLNVPTLKVQDEILLKLRLLNSIIKLRKKELQKLDQLIKARFVEMFGTLEQPSQDFTRDTLKNLCNKITDGKHGGCTQEDGSGRYFVGAREIYDDAVHFDTAPQISVEEFEKDYKRCNVEKGDFLIVNTGATIGKSAIAVDERTEHTLLQKSVALLKTKRSILNPVFLKFCYLVNDKMYKVESASAQPNLLLSKINATEIYVPPMSLQEEFATFVAQVNKSKMVIQKTLDEAQLLFNCLMQQYFG